ncbi:conserved hypothetical protein [Arthrobacter sp. 8AJ]|nr:conserved hypothetical protein [Arthrobacter sp. 8AJ]
MRYWGIRTPEQLLGNSGFHLGGSALLESAYWLVRDCASTANNYFRFTLITPGTEAFCPGCAGHGRSSWAGIR